MKPYALLFDYNGVIVTDEHLHEQAFAEAVRPYSVSITPQFYREYCLGRSEPVAARNIKHAFPEQLKDLSETELLKQKSEAYKLVANPQSIIAPGLKELLIKLKPHCHFAIVTGSRKESLESMLNATGIADFFDTLVTVEDTPLPKPNPGGYNKALEKLEITSAQSLAIEDTPVGIAAAKAAKVKVIGISSTLPTNYLTEADHILESITELSLELIEKLLKKRP